MSKYTIFINNIVKHIRPKEKPNQIFYDMLGRHSEHAPLLNYFVQKYKNILFPIDLTVRFIFSVSLAIICFFGLFFAYSNFYITFLIMIAFFFYTISNILHEDYDQKTGDYNDLILGKTNKRPYGYTGNQLINRISFYGIFWLIVLYLSLFILMILSLLI